jgi:hypothetical protein
MLLEHQRPKTKEHLMIIQMAPELPIKPAGMPQSSVLIG